MNRLWQEERGGFFEPLGFSWLNVALSAVLLPVLFWAGTAVVGYETLQNAVNRAAYAGQSQVTQTTTTSATPTFGMYQGGFTLQVAPAVSAAQTNWDLQLNDLEQGGLFSDVQSQVGYVQNQVVITATAEYEPVLLDHLLAVLPVLTHDLAIPMSVTSSDQASMS